MRYQLTARVFRQLTNNALYSDVRPVLRCCRRSRTLPHAVVVPVAPRRSLFGYSPSTPTKTKPATIDPGYKVLVDLNSHLSMGVRTPSIEDVIQALNAFVRYRYDEKIPFQETQITNIMGAFRFLQQNNTDIEGFGLAKEDLWKALKTLVLKPYDEGNTVRLQLAKTLFEELERRRLLDNEKGSTPVANVFPYSVIMSGCSQAVEARALVEKYFDSQLRLFDIRPWIPIINEFLRQDKEDEVLKTINVMRSHDIAFDDRVHHSITKFYAKKGDLHSMKRWYNTAIDDGGIPRMKTTENVLDACIREKEYEWGDSVFRSIFERRTPTPTEWRIILRWSAAKGKGVDEIERMMNVMLRRNEDLPDKDHVVPDITMINGLVELAMWRDDPYTAERYVALGEKWKIEPDVLTLLLQLEYRLQADDLDGAKASYHRLRAEDTSNGQDVPLINKLILALCEKKEPYTAIMSFVDELSERRATLELPTIAALCQLHLQNDEPDRIGPMLSTHIHRYSVLQYESIRDVFVKFILDRRNPDHQAWEAYSILSPTFPEMPVYIRTELMTEFFSRGRNDLGIHVFLHMRQHQNPSFRATVDTYTRCFEGIARAGAKKIESLYLVHNMLKVDSEIEPNTRLTNGLMLAYTACRRPGRALRFWNDIAHSREGPTYSSIQLALQACETAPFGERSARDIWARLGRFGIQVTRQIYAAYVGALSAQCAFTECVELIESAESKAGYKPDSLLIGTFYNAAPGQTRKERVEEWAKQAYPDVWQELLAIGTTEVLDRFEMDEADLEEDMNEVFLASIRVRDFKIDRSVEL